MEKAVCYMCQKPKATLECGSCKETICKKCAMFLDEDTFSFIKKVPEKLSHTTYCNPCYLTEVTPGLAAYNARIEKAKTVQVYYKEDSKQTRLIKRDQNPVKVKECADRAETLLRLAFMAVNAGFEGLVDVEIVSEKIRTGAYQTVKFSGSGIPAYLDPKKLNR